MQALLRDFQEYKACVRFLERLIRFLERKESPREYFITHFNQLESERLVPRGRPCGVSLLQAFPQFQFVDKRQVEKTRQQLLTAGKKPEDFNPYSQLKRWEPTHCLLTIKHQGRTYYQYVAVNQSATDRREYGNMGLLFGLETGSIPLTLDVVTYDDRHFTFKYTLVVELGKEADNVENAVNSRRQQLNSARSRIRQARTPQDQRRAELEALNLLMNYTTAFKGSRAATPEKLQALLSEIFQLYTDLRTPAEVNSHRKVGISLLQECVSLADAQANALAKKVLLQMTRYYGDAMPPEAYVSMANLAVAHQGDLAAARHYTEKAIERRDALGLYKQNKELKQRDLDLLPHTPFPVPAVPASP